MKPIFLKILPSICVCLFSIQGLSQDKQQIYAIDHQAKHGQQIVLIDSDSLKENSTVVTGKAISFGLSGWIKSLWPKKKTWAKSALILEEKCHSETKNEKLCKGQYVKTTNGQLSQIEAAFSDGTFLVKRFKNTTYADDDKGRDFYSGGRLERIKYEDIQVIEQQCSQAKPGDIYLSTSSTKLDSAESIKQFARDFPKASKTALHNKEHEVGEAKACLSNGEVVLSTWSGQIGRDFKEELSLADSHGLKWRNVEYFRADPYTGQLVYSPDKKVQSYIQLSNNGFN